MKKGMINTNLKCLITLPSSAILFSGDDALFFQSTMPLSILGKFLHFFFLVCFVLFFSFFYYYYFFFDLFLRSEGKNYFESFLSL